jgi:hypothetical protein
MSAPEPEFGEAITVFWRGLEHEAEALDWYPSGGAGIEVMLIDDAPGLRGDDNLACYWDDEIGMWVGAFPVRS